MWQKIEHHEHRFAQQPLSKIQRTYVKFFGGYVKQNKGAHHERQKSQPPNALKAIWKDLVAEKQAAKSRRKCIWKGASRSCPAPFFPGGALCVCGILSIYLSISTYISLYIVYIYIYTSLSLSLSLSRSSFWRGLRRAHVCASKLQ